MEAEESLKSSGNMKSGVTAGRSEINVRRRRCRATRHIGCLNRADNDTYHLPSICQSPALPRATSSHITHQCPKVTLLPCQDPMGSLTWMDDVARGGRGGASRVATHALPRPPLFRKLPTPNLSRTRASHFRLDIELNLTTNFPRAHRNTRRPTHDCSKKTTPPRNVREASCKKKRQNASVKMDFSDSLYVAALPPRMPRPFHQIQCRVRG